MGPVHARASKISTTLKRTVRETRVICISTGDKKKGIF